MSPTSQNMHQVLLLFHPFILLSIKSLILLDKKHWMYIFSCQVLYIQFHLNDICIYFYAFGALFLAFFLILVHNEANVVTSKILKEESEYLFRIFNLCKVLLIFLSFHANLFRKSIWHLCNHQAEMCEIRLCIAEDQTEVCFECIMWLVPVLNIGRVGRDIVQYLLFFLLPIRYEKIVRHIVCKKTADIWNIPR